MSAKHESAIGHVTGRAIYTDEQHPPVGMLSAYPVQVPCAHARIVSIDSSDASAMPGVFLILTAQDIPGQNNTGPIVHDEPLMPADEIMFYGQAVAWVIAVDENTARIAAQRVRVQYEPLSALLSLREAIAQQSFHLPPAQVICGDAPDAMQVAQHQLDGEIDIGGQDHFYLETQTTWAFVDSEGVVQLTSSTQHPTETQLIVARVLAIPAHRVVCRCLRMGGGFGGKETQANTFAAVAALAAVKTQRPVRIKLTRQLDMQLTGKRHPFMARYKVGFGDDGLLQALQVTLYADGGWSTDLSPPVLMRAMVHIDNAYFIPNAQITGLICKTNLVSNTAFRGFGGPQGMLIGEEIIDRVARFLNIPADQVRERNFYRPDQTPDRNRTPYGQPVVDNHMEALWHELKNNSDFLLRRKAINTFNDQQKEKKRGIAITPVKFGISFNKTEYNQAGALVHIYLDGSVQLNHGGTEMGQGLHTKMLAVAARSLGVRVQRIQLMTTSTDKVPNTSATAASSGSDLNGQAIKAACETLLERLRPIAAQLLATEAQNIEFVADEVFDRQLPKQRLTFEQVVSAAYAARVSLSSTGYYRTPNIHWDAKAGQGYPFYYFSYGAAVSEVEVCGLTGVYQLRRVDILHDVGDSLNEAIDRGQIEGGFVQGLGWLTCEQLCWNDRGQLLTDAPSTYKIPTVGEVPSDFRLSLFKRNDEPTTQVIFGSKGVGEPPLMLALSVREALRDAIAAFGKPQVVQLNSPATPEAVFVAIERVRNVLKK
jgi:xanthine dehydrogenase large subunit